MLAHETGHMFSLAHCIHYRSAMNGSNSLDGSDRRPLMLCPECLRKLQWNLGFDIRGRYQALEEFYRKNGLKKEAEWTKKRLARIESHIEKNRTE